MVVFILILILLAILFSTEKGRGLLEWLFLLPFKIIGFPFRVAAESKQKEDRAEAEKNIEAKKEAVESFRKSLGKEDSDLLVDSDIIWMLGGSFQDIQEQIALYKQFQRGEISKAYLKPLALIGAQGNNSLFLIKPEKIEELRK